jgi:hypothetical protein
MRKWSSTAAAGLKVLEDCADLLTVNLGAVATRRTVAVGSAADVRYRQQSVGMSAERSGTP